MLSREGTIFLMTPPNINIETPRFAVVYIPPCRDFGEERARIFGQWVEVQSVDTDADDLLVDEQLQLTRETYRPGL